MIAICFLHAAFSLHAQVSTSDPTYKRLKTEGIVLLQNKQYGLAAAKFDSALMLVPTSKAMLVNRANARIEIKNYDGAIEDCTRAIELDFTLAEAYFIRGYAYAMQKEYTLSMSDFDNAILLDNTHADSFYNRAVLRRELKDFAGACKDIDAAIQMGYTKAKFTREEFCK